MMRDWVLLQRPQKSEDEREAIVLGLVVSLHRPGRLSSSQCSCTSRLLVNNWNLLLSGKRSLTFQANVPIFGPVGIFDHILAEGRAEAVEDDTATPLLTPVGMDALDIVLNDRALAVRDPDVEVAPVLVVE